MISSYKNPPAVTTSTSALLLKLAASSQLVWCIKSSSFQGLAQLNLMKNILLSPVALLLLLTPPNSAGSPTLEPIGKPIRLPFPNDQLILGVGGFSYNTYDNIWTASSENIASVFDKDTPEAAVSDVRNK